MDECNRSADLAVELLFLVKCRQCTYRQVSSGQIIYDKKHFHVPVRDTGSSGSDVLLPRINCQDALMTSLHFINKVILLLVCNMGTTWVYFRKSSHEKTN